MTDPEKALIQKIITEFAQKEQLADKAKTATTSVPTSTRVFNRPAPGTSARISKLKKGFGFKKPPPMEEPKVEEEPEPKVDD